MLVPVLCVGCLVGGYLIFDYFDYLAHRSEETDSADYEFYYGQCYFKRLNHDDKFSTASLVAGADGPWLWMSETDGIKIDRNTAEESGKRIAKQLGLDEPEWSREDVRVSDDIKWSLTLTKVSGREWDSDVWISSAYADVPLAISMTKDGPRISLRCTEEELRKALGEPTRILRPAPFRHPGV